MLRDGKMHGNLEPEEHVWSDNKLNIKIYTTPGCHYCTQAKKLFQRAGINEWEEVNCSTVDRVLADYPEANAFPWIVIDGEPKGGLVEVAKHFLDIGLVKSNKSERT